MEQHHLDGLCIFGANRTFYLSGFHHVATERLVVFSRPPRASYPARAGIWKRKTFPFATQYKGNEVFYREYPGLKHPMLYLAELLQDKGLPATSGSGQYRLGRRLGYRGLALAEVAPQAKLTNIRDVIDDMRMIKSAEEIELICLSAHFGNVAHALLRKTSSWACRS
ncbi:MAG: aminopeptidase P family N-terminal domain-containing protein [Anaerolineae bacterium]